MVKIRQFEEKAKELFQQALIRGGVHFYIGQEAVAVGACAALREDDYITSNHRGHGHCIAKGGRLDLMMAELMGKATGYCKGKGGSMHIADLDRGILGANGLVGGSMPIAAGAALSAKLRGTGQVTVSFFGDGGANIGAFHESLNFAAIWKLPVVYVCENNLYAISTCAAEATAVENIADRAAGYNIPGVIVDGQDILAVYDAVSQAVQRARRGEGPSLLEAKTYRFEGHFTGDPGVGYRTKEEVEAWRQRDPIAKFRDDLTATAGVDEAQLKAIWDEAAQELEAAVAFAKASPEPADEELLTDIYA
ncbi:MAG: thiamine pyrophosphate-dependent dehydrogenase E1 component subunit alpha [Deltaproteobacteria bacterium]|nr:thiamine pyrophosphate-dependent dehydrogenase E1 component subunit alpha [Deltaproteobacteria bacterium]MBI3078958.1 thiamine pyrophosphate-dependent dehydrogenase E1 component subunit alpha [Deltaproteobacteria bacterium]